MDRTRRGLLSAGATAALAGLSGCFGLLGGGGGGGDGASPTESATATRTPTETPTERASFVRWLPEPRGFTGGRYQVLYYDLTGFRPHESALADSTSARVRKAGQRAAAPLGVDPAAVETVLRFRPGDARVVTGTFGAEAVADRLTNGRYVGLEDAYGGYRLLVGEGTTPPAVAVGDGVALLCTETGKNSPRAVARRLIDTERGRLARYQEKSEVLTATLPPLSGATHVAGGLVPRIEETNAERGRFAGMTSFGVGFDVGGDRTRLTYAIGFADEVRLDAVRTWATQHSDGLSAYSDLSVVREGPTAQVTGSVPTARLDFLAPGDP